MFLLNKTPLMDWTQVIKYLVDYMKVNLFQAVHELANHVRGMQCLALHGHDI